MHIEFTASGKNAGQISYFMGKHPDNPFYRETKYGTVEFKFLDYSDNYVEAYITFHPNGLSLIKESDYRGLEDYINDREFSLSTIFLTNIRNSIGHVLSYDYEGIDTKYNFNVNLGPLSTTLPDDIIVELFKPLGYNVEVEKIESKYNFTIDSGKVVEIRLERNTDIVSLFRHLYVLIPVIDNYKHYAISNEEINKLLRYGEGWLANHPKNEFISKRFVGYRQSMFENVMNQLEKEKDDEDEKEEVEEQEKRIGLGQMRYNAFADKINELGVKEVVDMGAGEGRLIELLVKSKTIKELIACEPTSQGRKRMYEKVEKWTRKKLVNVNPQIIQSSLFYKDERLKNKECIVLCEVIEHINIDRIDGVMETVLGYCVPQYFLISTPNFEYNVVYDMKTKFRHSDHRFEMTRTEFQNFINKHADTFGYDVEFIGIGEEHQDYGCPTQMAIMKRKDMNG